MLEVTTSYKTMQKKKNPLEKVTQKKLGLFREVE